MLVCTLEAYAKMFFAGLGVGIVATLTFVAIFAGSSFKRRP